MTTLPPQPKRIPPKKPLIAILGPTGTGKSSLALALAHHLSASPAPNSPTNGAEILNADALQLYEGLPIASNKLSLSEQEGIKHHLLDCVPVYDEPWTVGKYAAEAETVIAGVRERGNVPIVVGGTGYYVQAVVLRGGTVVEDELAALQVGKETVGGVREGDESAEIGREEEGREKGDGEGKVFLTVEEEEKRWPILAKRADVMLAELQKVDPVMASRWHPNDQRKIRRSLAIYLQTGRKASEVYAEQKVAREAGRLKGDEGSKGTAEGHPSDQANGLQEGLVTTPTMHEGESLLKHDALIFYLHSPPQALDPILSARTQSMLDRGLLDEIRYLRDLLFFLITSGSSPDTTRGIWIAIGYKEFAGYLDAVDDLSSARDLAEAEERARSPVDGDEGEENQNHSGPSHSVASRASSAQGETNDASETASDQKPVEEQSPETESETEKRLERLKAEGIERLQISTRQYSRRQKKWVRGKLVPALASAGAGRCLYVLDASDPSKYQANVVEEAKNIVDKFLAGEELPRRGEVFPEWNDVLGIGMDEGENGDGDGMGAREGEERKVRTCEMCGVTVTTGRDWERHLRSNRHRKAGRMEREMATREERIRTRGGKVRGTREGDEVEREAEERKGVGDEEESVEKIADGKI
ncbi:hypothetical protein MMC10_007357 [Thelotrema lepadinum]|nr:hypothetical protein [Thelotrema lepadinum]